MRRKAANSCRFQTRRDVGIFLQRFYVYAVEFVERGAIVGMRAHELDLDETAEIGR